MVSMGMLRVPFALGLVVTAASIASVAASVAHAGTSGASVVTIAIPADGQSQTAAVRVARLADEVYAYDPDAVLLDLERVLEGGDPPWVDKLAEGKQLAQKGRQAMDALELSVAADAFAGAIVSYEQAVAGLKDMTPLVEALAQQGAVYTLLSDARAAKASYARALSLDPAYRIEKGSTSPKVVSAFEAAMKEARAAGQGSLTVYSTTGAAEVWIDGVFRGIAPFTVDIGAGRHYVRVLRDGYLTFATGVDVKRGSEASVQASLRPAARLAKLEELSVRVPRNKESIKPVAELAAALQVDQLLAVVVEDENGSALLTATLVDGISGKQLARASRAFAPNDSFFDRDVRTWLDDKIRRAASRDPDAPAPSVRADGNTPGDGTAEPGPGSLLPGEAEAVETPPAVTAGWALVVTGGVLGVGSVAMGLVSFNLYDTYRNKLPSQLDQNLEPIRSTWLTTSIITDAAWVLGAAAVGGGALLLVNGYAEMRAQEEVVNP
jgi:tetratricopeptide (TPR) repeat protein